jgi:pectate lyase
MKMLMRIFAFFLVHAAAGPVGANELPAFPGAEGFGAKATGGRGGRVIFVTNLNDSGLGSLRAACEAEGPRIVIFKVSGTIDGDVKIKHDSITIAGQSAPGDGITIKGNLTIDASNVVLRYIRVRTDHDGDAVGTRYRKNIILDHVSASWSTDEVLSLYHNEDVTVQWCMITEACAKPDGSHRFGGIWGNNRGTYHHNLIAHNDSRNPRWASGCGYNDYRNNVLYNWDYESCYGGEARQVGDRRNPPIEFSTINMVANYYKPGPATRSNVRDRIAKPSSRGEGGYGSWSDSDGDGMPDEWEIKYGLDPHDPADANGDLNGSGYTNIEEYINGTEPTVFVDYTKPENNVNTLSVDSFSSARQ